MSINSQPAKSTPADVRSTVPQGVAPPAAHTTAASSGLSSSRPARLACLVFALLFLVVGVVGLVQGGWNIPRTVAPDAATTVGGLGGSPLLNLAHLMFGLLALLAVFSARGPELVGTVVSVALVVVIAYDVVALIARQPGEIFGVRWPGLVLHVVGLLALVVVIVSSHRMRRAPGLHRSDQVRQW